MALLKAQMHGEDMPGFPVYLVVEKPDPNNPRHLSEFMNKFHS
jgi:hypothetical protein